MLAPASSLRYHLSTLLLMIRYHVEAKMQMDTWDIFFCDGCLHDAAELEKESDDEASKRRRLHAHKMTYKDYTCIHKRTVERG